MIDIHNSPLVQVIEQRKQHKYLPKLVDTISQQAKQIIVIISQYILPWSKC